MLTRLSDMSANEEKAMELVEAARLGNPIAATLWVLINRWIRAADEITRAELIHELREFVR